MFTGGLTNTGMVTAFQNRAAGFLAVANNSLVDLQIVVDEGFLRYLRDAMAIRRLRIGTHNRHYARPITRHMCRHVLVFNIKGAAWRPHFLLIEPTSGAKGQGAISSDRRATLSGTRGAHESR